MTRAFLSTFTAEWLKAAAVRAIKTMAQTAGAMLTLSSSMGDVNWKLVISTATLAGIYSILTSIAGLPEVPEEIPEAEENEEESDNEQ